MAKIEILKPFVLSYEGGYSNVSGDKGGATNKGVTIATFRSVFGQGKTITDLRRMTDEQWMYIFRKYYWDKWRADEIKSQSIANLLVDWYWMSGSYGIKIPQYSMGLLSDGLVGPKTLGAINGYPNEKELFTKLWNEREAFFKRIGVKTQKKFLDGWLRRLNGIKYGLLVCNGGKIINY